MKNVCSIPNHAVVMPANVMILHLKTGTQMCQKVLRCVKKLAQIYLFIYLKTVLGYRGSFFALFKLIKT